MALELSNKISRLEQVISSRQDWLFRFAYMRIGNRADAEDVVQNTFLKVFQKLDRLTSTDELERYLIQSVSNACKDYFRCKSIRTVALTEAEQLAEHDPDSAIHEEYLRISRLLDDLPPEQSEIIRLKCYDGLTFKDISVMEGIPEATAKSRYRYGIMNIQKKLIIDN